MVKFKGLSKKLTSVFATLAISATALVGLGTAANAAAPGNDNFSSATPISFSGGTVSSQSNVDATRETNEYKGTGSGSNEWDRSVWYSWEPTATGSATIDACSATYKTVIAVYAYPSANTPTLPTSVPDANGGVAEESGCGTTNGAKLIFTVNTGYKYRIQVSSKGGTGAATGTFNLIVSAPTSYVSLDRVTICHRTHATTNPYRLITVSTKSIVAANGDIRGHGKHATDARRYNPNLYGVFDPNRRYASNAKLWGDIIPPFKDRSTGAVFTGLNWSWGAPSDVDSNSILSDGEFKSVATGAAGSAIALCTGSEGILTAKQLFDLERGKGGLSKTEILDEIAETDEFETDPANKEKSGVESQLPAREGPKRQPGNQIAQSLAGIVWMDLNRNGFQEDNEPNMSNIRVTVQQGTAPVSMGRAFSGFGTGAKVFTELFGANVFTTALDTFSNKFTNSVNWIRNLFGMATTYTVYTDISGAYLFKSIDSGDWYVSGVVPTGLEVTYDSLGTNDAVVDTSVPAGGSAFTWIGLVGTNSNTGINSLVKTPTGGNATEDVVLTFSGADGIFCNTDDINYVITPVNGVITVSGIPAGTYYVRQIGSTGTIADITITNGQTYSTTVTTTAGVRCDVLTESELFAANSSGGSGSSGSGGTTRASQVLANTGNALGGLPGVSLLLLLTGAGAVFLAVKLERKFKN